MSPEYFTHTLTLYEAELFCKGLRRRERGAWERARYNAYYSIAPHVKDFDPDRLKKFPWEEEKEVQNVSQNKAKEYKELKELWDMLKNENNGFLKD